MSALHAIILAAGMGKRMKSTLPKVLHPICGRPMIMYSVEAAMFAGVKNPIAVLGQGADEVKAILPQNVRVAIQEKPNGTGDAVLAARKTLTAVTGNVLILYADAPLLRRTTIQHLFESHTKSGATCTLLTAHLADPTGYGRITRDEFGQVNGIVEESDSNAAQRSIREVNIGPLICKIGALYEALDAIKPSNSTKELYLTQVINYLAGNGKKINVAHASDVWESLGINSRVELAKATGIVRRRIIDIHLRRGVTVEDPESTYIDYGVEIGQDSVVKPGSYIEAGVVVGKRCSIGPNAHLRAGTVIGNDTRIGNFAEIVRTQIGDRVKVNHMSYLGDAVVADDVNIGAGTITANFDGFEKHKTQIGKGAFIGTSTVLIAPVEVGAGAATGAGCVIPKNRNVAARTVVAGVPAEVLRGALSPAVIARKRARGEDPVAVPEKKTKGKKTSEAGAKPAKKAAKKARSSVKVAKKTSKKKTTAKKLSKKRS